MCLTALASLPARRASAQLIDNYLPALVGDLAGDSVLTRTQPAFESSGVRVGSFIIRPRIEEGFGYDSDASGAPGGAGSVEVGSHASVSASSDWSRNSLNAFIGVDDTHYTSQASQNETDWTASLGGAYDIGRDRFSGSYTHLAQTQEPGAIGAAGVDRKLPYSVDDVRLTYTVATRSPFTFVPDFEFRDYQFGSALLSNGVPDSASNRTTEQGTLTTRYEFSPGRSAVFVVRGTRIDYATPPMGAVNASSNGLTVLAGLDYTATALVRYRALAGYQIREFDSRQVSNLAEPTIEGSVIWSPSLLTTVTANIRRDIEDPSDATLAGFTYTVAEVDVRHELLRNLLIRGYIGWQHGDYRGTPPSLASSPLAQGASTQDIYSGAVSATLLINRNLRATASYGLTLERTSYASSLNRSVGLISLSFGL